MQFQITESQQIVTWASLLLLPSVKVLSSYKHRTSTPAAREHYKLCVFLLQVTPSTAVDRQIYSVHARDTHENDEADL